jgi:hypothetical protein
VCAVPPDAHAGNLIDKVANDTPFCTGEEGRSRSHYRRKNGVPCAILKLE